jgi:hypothetical protein
MVESDAAGTRAISYVGFDNCAFAAKQGGARAVIRRTSDNVSGIAAIDTALSAMVPQQNDAAGSGAEKNDDPSKN